MAETSLVGPESGSAETPGVDGAAASDKARLRGEIAALDRYVQSIASRINDLETRRVKQWLPDRWPDPETPADDDPGASGTGRV